MSNPKRSILYQFPQVQETKKGTFFVDEVKFKEIVKDPEYDTDSEIDHDFRYIQNCLMCTVLNDRMTEHNFSLNLN
jgi:hypothetical protein